MVIAQAGEELRLLLEKAVNGEVTPRSSIEAAAATYSFTTSTTSPWKKKRCCPLPPRKSPADWAAVRDAAPERHEPPFGDASEPRFHELRTHILAAGG